MHAILQGGQVHWFWYWQCLDPCNHYEIRLVDYRRRTKAFPDVPVFGNRRLGRMYFGRLNPVVTD